MREDLTVFWQGFERFLEVLRGFHMFQRFAEVFRGF